MEVLPGQKDAFPLVHSEKIWVPDFADQDNIPVVIDEPGYYYLTEDTVHQASADSLLIRIESSQVVFDARGHSIERTNFSDIEGIRAESPDGGTLEDVLVRNLTLKEWYRGITFKNVKGGEISGVEAPFWRAGTFERDPFLVLENCHDVYLHGNTIERSSSVALRIEDSKGIVVDDNWLSAESGQTVEVQNAPAFVLKNTAVPSGRAEFSNIDDSLIKNNLIEVRFTISGANRSKIIRNTISGFSFLLSGANESRVEGNHIATADGLEIIQCAETVITRNRVEAGEDAIGISLIGGHAAGNLIFDNYISAGTGANIGRHVPENAWNIEPRPGRNIVGGPYIAGNYWDHPEEEGFSRQCDSRPDGICEHSYPIDDENNDAYPLVDPLESDYDTWVANHFSVAERENEDIVARDADPGNTGIPNAFRYLFDLDPQQPDHRLLPGPGVMKTDRGERYLTLTFSRRLDATDADLWVETSNNLEEWKPADNISVENRHIEGTLETLTIRHEEPLAERETRFLRIRTQIDE